MKIDCLIPAAGLSSRMGQWKLTLPYRESTIIETCIKNTLGICSRAIIVTGFRGEELKRIVEKIPGTVSVSNKNYTKVMFSSIKEGVPLVESDWFFITMGDMPEIDESIFRQILDYMYKDEEKYEIFRPLYKEKRGHPVLLHKNTIKTILSEPIDSEMKNVFFYHKVMELKMDLDETFRDIDTPEEYQIILDAEL
ncbi:MAG: NTP transferase domain-containing protein [Spirochaetales bacterium]|nr:NTP transferase domain-containing protein [Spirochaetales bacterium]